MAVEAVVAVILEKLTDLLIQEFIAFDNVIDQVEHIRTQLRRMRLFLVDPELTKDQGAAAAAWATEYLTVLFSAENTIENYALSLAARGNRKIGFFQSRGITLFSDAYGFFGPSKQFRRELNRLEDRIKLLNDKRSRDQAANASSRGQNPNFNDVLLCPRRSKSLSLSSSYRKHQLEPTNSNPDQEGHTLIGRTEDLARLIDRIKGNQGEGIIPLAGPAGSGKTTLVQTIYNRRDIQAHFNCRALVHLPDHSVQIPQLLASILQQVLKSKESGGTLTDEHLISRVKESLEDKTYLVVLDNESTVQCWDKLRRAFPNLGTEDSKSKVIIITRDKKEAANLPEQDSGCGEPHDLETLCDDHSWELFIEKSCIKKKKESDKADEPDEDLKGEILKKCEGCPFNIVLLGGLLSTKLPGFDEWKWYLRQADWLGSTGIEQKDIIKTLCYNDLPAHSKLCLLYMALFPYEGEIHVRRLQRLWLAEGFIRRIPEKDKEDTVEEYFNDLVRRNLIKISKYRSDGSPRTCLLPHALLDYLSPIAHEISLFSIHQGCVSTKRESLGVRRVIEYRDNPTPESASSPSYENLRSYISFNLKRNDTPATEVGNFISKIIGDKGFGVLRVLDLEGVYKPTLPETLKQLFHLRYLGLRWTFIDILPKSFGKLPYLETLDLKRTYINCLPSSFWKLEHLRHLNLPDIRLDFNQKKGHNHLTELRTLVGLIVDDQTPKDEVMHICKLRELGVTCQASDSDKLMNWIQELTDLRSLWLKSKDKMGRPSDIKLKTLIKSSNLSHVSLLGNLATLPALDEFPPNLKVLALSVSQLNDDPMTILSELPKLTVLRLLADSYLGTVMNCPADGFKNLKVLKLWALKELVEWKVVKGGMPKLKELSIRNCPKLKQLPDWLIKNPLEELTLTSMPKEFVDEVKQKKHGDTTLTLNDYEFTPLPWENDPDLWKDL